MKLNKKPELNKFKIYKTKLKENKIRGLKWISLKFRMYNLYFNLK